MVLTQDPSTDPNCALLGRQKAEESAYQAKHQADVKASAERRGLMQAELDAAAARMRVRKHVEGWEVDTHGPSCPSNTKGYSSTYLAMGFANVRAGTQKRLPFSDELQASFLSCGSPQAALLKRAPYRK